MHLHPGVGSIAFPVTLATFGFDPENPKSGRSTSRPHVVLEMQGAQMYSRSTMPAPRIRAIVAKVVHVAEVEVARAGSSLFVAGSSTTSSAVKPHLFALAMRERRRRDAFSQDFLDVRLPAPRASKQLPRCPIISRISRCVSFSARSGREFRASTGTAPSARTRPRVLPR